MKTTILVAMALISLAGCGEKERAGGHAGHASERAAEKKTLYRCPMHPQIVQDRPGECPICHMSLVPVEEDPAPAASTGTRADGGTHAAIAVSARQEQWMGVRTAAVERRRLERVIRASARVAYDPALYNALAEYQEAVAARRRGAGGEELARAAELRLRRMGVDPAQAERMSEGKGAAGLLSPTGGLVWVYVQAYQDEAPLLKRGLAVEVAAPAFPGKTFAGTIAAVDAVLDPETRTVTARVATKDPEGLLRPEMYVDAAVRVPLGERLALPAEALMDTGTRRFVFVREAPGRYAPRDVVLGRAAEGYYEVLDGLAAGEEVAVSGNFLIDSESRMKAAVAGFAGGHDHDR